MMESSAPVNAKLSLKLLKVTVSIYLFALYLTLPRVFSTRILIMICLLSQFTLLEERLVYFDAADPDCFTPTKDLPHVVLDRCHDYFLNYRMLGFVDNPPRPGRDETDKYCRDLFKTFLHAFAFKDACTVTMEDYIPFLTGPGESYIEDKVLFWSKHQELSLQLADGGRRAAVVANTLPGYLVTDLVWCGEPRGSSKRPDVNGINYKRCPTCKTDKDDKKLEHFEVFWAIASQKFAKRASGVVRHLVNGALGTEKPDCAYHDNTFFAQHELSNINKDKVTEFRIIVANEPGKTVHEKCGQGTIKQLQEEVKAKIKKEPICIENPREVMEIFCKKREQAKRPECQPSAMDRYPRF